MQSSFLIQYVANKYFIHYWCEQFDLWINIVMFWGLEQDGLWAFPAQIILGLYHSMNYRAIWSGQDI